VPAHQPSNVGQGERYHARTYWVALVLTFAGGLIFARGYLGRGGFALALVLHAVCGWIIFTSGLGSFFYHGAVGG